ncbi:MAG: ATP-dependent metallopeptidase FtsH/Yme1/Tma family protein [Chloroflexi bacterium]|nr:ATP-dependent metallopeptidase FtsH/Yme1/Tma family protein [Chloroflexota bacterium]
MNPNNQWYRNGLVYLLIIVTLAALAFNIFQQPRQTKQISIADVASAIKNGEVSKAAINGSSVTITYKSGGQTATAQFSRSPNVTFGSEMESLGVTKEQYLAANPVYDNPPQWDSIVQLLISILPFLLIGGLFFFLMRQAQSGNNQAMSFGKSRARMFSGDKPTVTFADVAGVEEAKAELQEVVEFLKEPDKFTALGARIPKGVLLVGPPGTGKTLLARAVAGEANVPFFSISGSEFVEMFVGVGASRVRDLFDTAKRNSPCIVFVDEIDAVGRHRGAGLGGSHDEREQTLNQILVEMDGFDTDTNVIIIASTNRPDILDPALLRPGRFDRRVVLDRPDMVGRKAILEVHTRGKPLGDDVNLVAVAKSTPGFSGADIENLVNEAAILAARRNKKAISMSELQEAVEKVIAGPERKSRIISEDEKKVIAFHEAGHAVVMRMLPNCDPVYKVSIVSRGMALGITMHLPEDDRYLMRRSKFLDDMAALLGGRAAEQLVFGDITTGASNDLERVTDLSRSMVTRYGMSDSLGPRTFGDREELVFLGREISEQRNYSEEVAQQIDNEVKNLVMQSYDRAIAILTQYRNKLDELADRLIKVETVDAAEFEAIFADAPKFERPRYTPIPATTSAPNAPKAETPPSSERGALPPLAPSPA